MKKPAHLREETWKFLQRELKRMSDEELEFIGRKIKCRSKNRQRIEKAIIEDPASFLFHLGIFEHPELLKNSVIELEDEVDYLIKPRAARSLAEGDHYITLKRLVDQENYTVERESLVRAFANNHSLEQLE